MSQQALARKPVEPPPAARADTGFHSAPPVQALDEMSRRLNASTALVAQRALAERLGSEGVVQLKQKRKKEGQVSDDDEDHSDGKEDKSESDEDVIIEQRKKTPIKKNPSKKTAPKKNAPKKSKLEIISDNRPEDPKIEEKDDSSYSDSEDGASEETIKLARKHKLSNYTKWGTRGQKQEKPTRGRSKKVVEKTPRKKVRNKIMQGGLAAARKALMGDAKAIHDKAESKQSLGGSTVTTALVIDNKNKIYRRFAFTNLGLMPPAMRKEAEARGYHVVKAPRTHAEGQLIQYLYLRQHIYKHEDMGVDKDHCIECQVVMKDYFGGEDYGTQAKKGGEKFPNYYTSPLLFEAVGRNENDPITPHREETGMQQWARLKKEKLEKQEEAKKKRGNKSKKKKKDKK